MMKYIILIVQDGMNIDHNYYDNIFYKKKKKEFTMY